MQTKTGLTPEIRVALRAAVLSGVQTLCLNCLHGVHEEPTSTATGGASQRWTHGPGGWEGLRCPRRLTVAKPFHFAVLLDALDDALGPAEPAAYQGREA